MSDAAFSNFEAEQSALGAAIRSQSALKLVVELDPAELYYPAHRLILQAMKELYSSNDKVDLVTLDHKLGAAERIKAVGGINYIVEIVEKTPSASGIKSYIGIIKDCAGRRKLKAIGEALIKASGDLERKIDDTREKAALSIKDVRTGDAVPVISQADAVIQTYDKIAESQKQEGQPEKDRIRTGFKKLDELTGGLYGSKMIVIGARPSVGKSIFALTMCVNAARQGKRVLFVSLEMEADEIMEREFAAESSVSLSEITSDKVSTEAWEKLAESMNVISKRQIFYCTEAFTVERVRKAAFQVYESGGLDLICVDYLQLMSVPRGRGNRNEEVSEISRGLKRLAQEMKIPIIALSQLNRSSEKSVGGKKVKREPTMSEARDSGAIEQDANIFILLHDPGKDEIEEHNKETYEALKKQKMKMILVNVDKNRQGKKARFYVAFDGEHQKFINIADPNEERNNG